MAELQTVVEGLAFPEGPRWHDGRLFFSDQHAHQVLALIEKCVFSRWLPIGSLAKSRGGLHETGSFFRRSSRRYRDRLWGNRSYFKGSR